MLPRLRRPPLHAHTLLWTLAAGGASGCLESGGSDGQLVAGPTGGPASPTESSPGDAVRVARPTRVSVPVPVPAAGVDAVAVDRTPLEPEPTPVELPDDPNLIPQSELFSCSDPAAPRSSPARLARMDAPEWRVAASQSSSAPISLPNDPTHAFSTWVADETLDYASLEQYFQLGGVANRWTVVTNSGGRPKLQLMRTGGSADFVPCFQDGRTPNDSCIRSFVVTFLREGIYHAEPTEAEVDRMVAFAKARIAEETYSTPYRNQTREARNRTIEMMGRAAWLSSRGMFRSEVGTPTLDDPGRRRLDDAELANALAYALTDHGAFHPLDVHDTTAGPHVERRLQPIYDAYAAGSLSQTATIAALVRHYLGGRSPELTDPAGLAQTRPPGSSDGTFQDGDWMSPKLTRFFREWLGYEHVSDVFKDALVATTAYETSRTPNRARHSIFQGRGYQQYSLRSELDTVIARAVAEDRDVLGRLLTTRDFWVRDMEPGSYASRSELYTSTEVPYRNWVYNLDYDTVGDIANTPEERWRTLPADERGGILTHPAWLAAHGGNLENDASIIYRGKWVWQNMLCGWLDELPAGLEAMLDPNTRDQTARSRVHASTAPEACQNCHYAMNPFGDVFELYNHAGFLRADDHGRAPDGSATLRFTPPHAPPSGETFTFLELSPDDRVLSDDMSVSSAADMSERFSRSPHVRQCFVRQLFRFFMRRPETRADACTLAEMDGRYQSSGGSLVETVATLLASDTFTHRTLASEATP